MATETTFVKLSSLELDVEFFHPTSLDVCVIKRKCRDGYYRVFNLYKKSYFYMHKSRIVELL